jgi:hypothetical protein
MRGPDRVSSSPAPDGRAARTAIAARTSIGDEGTTYGDISIAVRGDTKAARVSAERQPAFGHSRIPSECSWRGVINPNWHDDEGRGPNYCRKLLEEQGVTFADDRADPSKRVTWEWLCRRDETEPVAE